MALQLPSDTRGLQGAAWVATIALFCSGYYGIRVLRGPIVLEWAHLLFFVPFLLFGTCLCLTYGRRSTWGWVLLLILSAIGTSSIFSKYWGSTIMDAGEQAALRYYAYSFLGDALLAFGSFILLVVSVIALFVDLRIRSEAD